MKTVQQKWFEWKHTYQLKTYYPKKEMINERKKEWKKKKDEWNEKMKANEYFYSKYSNKWNTCFEILDCIEKQE